MPPLVRHALLLFALLSLPATPASGQVTSIIAGLFNSVNSIAFSAGGAILIADDAVAGDCGPGACALHLQVLLDLPSPEGVTLEIGLGTGVLRGFRLADPTVDFYGSARSLPSVAVYATTDHVMGTSVVLPYAGMRVGFSQLWNARAYDLAGQAYSVSGEAFDFGLVGGLWLARTALRGLYLEVALDHRRFDSLNWSFPGAPVLPPNWPRALDLSSFEVTLGWQFRLTRSD